MSRGSEATKTRNLSEKLDENHSPCFSTSSFWFWRREFTDNYEQSVCQSQERERYTSSLFQAQTISQEGFADFSSNANRSTLPSNRIIDTGKCQEHTLIGSFLQVWESPRKMCGEIKLWTGEVSCQTAIDVWSTAFWITIFGLNSGSSCTTVQNPFAGIRPWSITAPKSDLGPLQPLQGKRRWNSPQEESIWASTWWKDMVASGRAYTLFCVFSSTTQTNTGWSWTMIQINNFILCIHLAAFLLTPSPLGFNVFDALGLNLHTISPQKNGTKSMELCASRGDRLVLTST